VSFLELTGLEKTYPDGTRAVRGIDLLIERGELVVLLGPSGCGKTTTLRMIAGLELATGGRVTMDGKDVTSSRPSARDVGFVFQFYALYPHLSARENIAFPLACAGLARAERAAAVERVAQRLGLVELLDRRPAQLSGGDQQRVALARAMVRKPAVYLMDEPLGTLDADLRLELCELIRAQQLELGVTTIYVTHDQEEALRLADRIVVMSAGRILQVGTPAEVYDHPASLFVARFVGSPGMNFVEGELAEEGRLFRRGALALPLDREADGRTGAAVLGVRPEFVTVDEPDSRRSRPLLTGEVLVDEFLGASRCLHVATEAGTLVARAPADRESLAGCRVELSVDVRHARLFDPTSEELLP